MVAGIACGGKGCGSAIVQAGWRDFAGRRLTNPRFGAPAASPELIAVGLG
jgi:hypothetical protein